MVLCFAGVAHSLILGRKITRSSIRLFCAPATGNNFEPIHITKEQESVNTAKWLKRVTARGFEPAYGGFWPGNPDAKRHKVTILADSKSYTLMVPVDRFIYFYFEEQGIDLPIVNKQRMCRQGCCTICTGRIMTPSGEEPDVDNPRKKVKMDAPLGLLKDFRKDGFVLTCCAYPTTDNLVLQMQSEDNMYIKQWSEGFEGGGVEWGGFLPDDD